MRKKSNIDRDIEDGIDCDDEEDSGASFSGQVYSSRRFALTKMVSKRGINSEHIENTEEQGSCSVNCKRR